MAKKQECKVLCELLFQQFFTQILMIRKYIKRSQV